MHIVDGALSMPVLATGAVMAAGGIALGLRALPLEKVPAAGVLAASFFVASLIHVPVPPTTVHLILNGLAGLILGWAAFPALFVGLLLQAVFFGFGGLTVLGVNCVAIALPAVMVHYLCRRGLRSGNASIAAAWGAVGGGGAIFLTALLVALALAATGDAFIPAAKLVVITHIPVMALEAAITAAAVYLIRLAKPELFGAFQGATA